METSRSELKAIIPLHGQVSFGLNVRDLEERDAEKARRIIGQIFNGLKVGQAVTVYYRYLLGKQLLLIQNNGLWRELLAPGIEASSSFTYWMDEHFPVIAGDCRDTGWSAIRLAKSPAINGADENVIRSMTSVSNAYAIAKAERDGRYITPEIVAAASTTPVAEFREKYLGEKGPSRGALQATTDSAHHARALAEIIATIKNADHRALKTLSTIIRREVLPLAGDNPSDAVDFIISAIQEAIHSTTDADKEATRTSDVPIEDDDDDEQYGNGLDG
jgi:hypothetical protein